MYECIYICLCDGVRACSLFRFERIAIANTLERQKGDDGAVVGVQVQCTYLSSPLSTSERLNDRRGCWSVDRRRMSNIGCRISPLQNTPSICHHIIRRMAQIQYVSMS